MALYTIEFVNDGNSGHIWAPSNERIRGRFSFANVAHRDIGSDALKEMSRSIRFVPGQYVQIDTEQFIGRVIDPLGETRDGKETWDKIDTIIRRHIGEFGSPMKPIPLTEVKLSVNQMKEWLYEMARCIETGKAQVVPGSDEILTVEQARKVPGKRRRDIFNTGDQRGTGKPDDDRLAKFTDEVKVPAGYGPKTATADA